MKHFNSFMLLIFRIQNLIRQVQNWEWLESNLLKRDADATFCPQSVHLPWSPAASSESEKEIPYDRKIDYSE